MRNKKILWIVRTAVLIALLVTLQWVTKPLGQFVTGSCVNFVLVAAVLIGGFYCGATVALISPFMAFLLQIAPMPIYLVPGVAIGNLVLVAVYFVLLSKVKVPKKVEPVMWVVTIIVAAAAKFAAMWLVVGQVIVAIAGAAVPAKAVAQLTTYPQLVTALIGGVVAMAVVKPVLYALKKR